ncbi:MAG: porphobilinogen synthase [Endozoicomonadaceae bacterium]|nr:porphobilinogen synthase [Endozoicomonadaceae bacterium]
MLLPSYPKSRPRRLRATPAIRSLVRENNVSHSHLILPLFIKAGLNGKKEISSMPGHYQLSLKDLATEINEIQHLGIAAVILFGIPANKDDYGSDAYSDQGIIQQAIKTIRIIAPDMLIIADICFCEYTSHGHCGIVHQTSRGADVNNDHTLELLKKTAVSYAHAGADILAPSGMMDGMVETIRAALDQNDFSHLPILSYAVKYASSLYSPFRDAAEGAPAFGDRNTYQMDLANGNEALHEAALDVQEGADMLMVKPGHTYLDIIWRIKQAYPHLPLGAYHPSGEFAMIKAAAKKGWVDEKQAVKEILTSMKRAGADFIITYYAKEFCHWQNSAVPA